MRFFQVVMSGAALISAALAIEFNSWPSSVTAGETVTLTYSPQDATVTILLKKGLSTDLQTVDTLTTTSTGGSFEWTVPSDLADGADYAFEIQQEGEDPNYTGQFSLSGGEAPVSSAVTFSSSASAAPSSSAGYATKESSSASETASSVEVTSTVASTTISTAVITSYATASGTGSIPTGANGTISTAGPTSTGEPPLEHTGAASSFGVNAAALFGAMGAFAYFV